jgi:hypothetical protein
MRSLRSSRHRIRRNICRVRERCVGSVEAVFVQLVRKCPVPELRRVRARVDIHQCTVGQRDLMDAFVKIRYSFLLRTTVGSRPQVSCGVDASVGLLAGHAWGLAALRISRTMRRDKVTIQGEIVVSGYYQFSRG